MRTVYPTTAPNWHDTRKIATDKWLQQQRGDGVGNRTPTSLFFSIPSLTNHDTKLSVIQKILYSDVSAVGVEISSSAVTAFDGSFVTISWTNQGGGGDSGYVVYRDNAPIAYLGSGESSYVDTTVEPGETYEYFVLYHAS